MKQLLKAFRDELESKLAGQTNYPRKQIEHIIKGIYENVGIDIEDTNTKLFYDIISKLNYEISKTLFISRSHVMKLFDTAVLSVTDPKSLRKKQNKELKKELDKKLKKSSGRNELIL